MSNPITQHFQGYPLKRFLRYRNPGDTIKCTNCDDIAIVPGKVRLMGGPYLAYRKKYKREEENRWIDEPATIQQTTHFPFQCQQCGKLQAVEQVSSIGDHWFTETSCLCGGELSTAHPMFCPVCSYNKELDFDSDLFIAGQMEMGRLFENNAEGVLNALDKIDIKEPPKMVSLEQGAELNSESFFVEEVEINGHPRFEIQYYLMEIFRPDEHQWRSKWQMLYSDEDLLVLVDPDDPCTIILEVDYADVPLEAGASGSAEIRLISDDAQRKILKCITYQTLQIGALDWVSEHLYDILERDWE